jgi:hypothetical protein
MCVKMKNLGGVLPACGGHVNVAFKGVIGDPPLPIAKNQKTHFRKGGMIMAAEEIKIYSTPT